MYYKCCVGVKAGDHATNIAVVKGHLLKCKFSKPNSPLHLSSFRILEGIRGSGRYPSCLHKWGAMLMNPIRRVNARNPAEASHSPNISLVKPLLSMMRSRPSSLKLFYVVLSLSVQFRRSDGLHSLVPHFVRAWMPSDRRTLANKPFPIAKERNDTDLMLELSEIRYLCASADDFTDMNSASVLNVLSGAPIPFLFNNK